MTQEEARVLAVVVVTVLSIAISFAIARMRGRGLSFGGEPDPRLLQDVGRQYQLEYLPREHGAFLSGAYNGAHVSVEAKWWPRQHRYRPEWGRTGVRAMAWETQTTVRAAFGVPMPHGMHLRRQNALAKLADALVNGDEIVVEDHEFDQAFLIHGDDVDAVGRVLTPPARRALMVLAKSGDVWVDEASIRLVLPQYVSGVGELGRVLDALILAVHEMRGGAPVGVGADAPRVPVAMTIRKPLLSGLLRKAASAGFNMTQAGRDVLASLPGQPCAVEVDVEHVVPYAERTGRVAGITLSGVVVGSTGRIDLHLTHEAAANIGELHPGDRVHAEGTIEHYDHLRDRAEVIAAEVARKVDVAGRSEVAFVRSPVAEKVERALASGAVDDVLDAIYTGREARERMAIPLRGRKFPIRGDVVDAVPTPPLRVNRDDYRKGLTVLVRHASAPRPLAIRFPNDRTEWLKSLSIGAEIEVEAAFVEWDEIAEHAVFEERGE